MTGLGKGLDALFSDTKISESGIYVHLSYKAAIPNAQNNGSFVAVPSGSFSITLS